MKIQKFPGGARLRTPLEACAFAARLGNRLVFILDPRLKKKIYIYMHIYTLMHWHSIHMSYVYRLQLRIDQANFSI